MKKKGTFLSIIPVCCACTQDIQTGSNRTMASKKCKGTKIYSAEEGNDIESIFSYSLSCLLLEMGAFKQEPSTFNNSSHDPLSFLMHFYFSRSNLGSNHYLIGNNFCVYLTHYTALLLVWQHFVGSYISIRIAFIIIMPSPLAIYTHLFVR